MNRLPTLLVTVLVLTHSLYSATLPIQAIALTSSSPAAKANAEAVNIYVRLSASNGIPRTRFGLVGPSFTGWTISLVAFPNGFCPGTMTYSTKDAFNQVHATNVRAAGCTVAVLDVKELENGVYLIQAIPIVFSSRPPTQQTAQRTPWMEGEYLFRLEAIDGGDIGDVLGTFKM